MHKKYIETWDKDSKKWVKKLMSEKDYKDFTDSHQVIDVDQYGIDPSDIKKCVHEIQAKAKEIIKELEKRG